MKDLLPIEIVGGGLAGLALGVALRRASVPVMIVEAGEYPRHRVCGEFIAGLAESTINRLGLAPLLADALQHCEVAWFVRELKTRTRLAETEAVPGRIFATGRRRGDSPWIGLKFHVRNLRLTRELELHLGDQAYVGLAQIEDHRVNVCGLFRRRALSAKGPDLLIGYLRATGLAALAERVTAAEPDSASCCAMIPPFTGNGMAMAFQSAERALDPLIAYSRCETDWPETQRLISARLSRQFHVRLASANALHPFLLRPRRQRLLGTLTRAGLLPLRPLYQLLH
jgi:hypothetical protein